MPKKRGSATGINGKNRKKTAVRLKKYGGKEKGRSAWVRVLGKGTLRQEKKKKSEVKKKWKKKE